MQLDLDTEYDYFSQKPGSICSYGAEFNFDMLDTGEEDVDATTNFHLELDGSTEKYLAGGNRGMFAFGESTYDFYGGTWAEDVDDNMDLEIGIGAGYGRVVYAKPVAQAYAIADAVGNTSDETVLAIATVIGAADTYEGKYKDDAMQTYYNDLAVASGDPSAAMTIYKVLNSSAYNISDRATGYSLKVGHENNYLREEGNEDKGYLTVEGKYAKPMGLNQQFIASFDLKQDLTEEGDGVMTAGAWYFLDHSYNWSSNAGLIYTSNIDGAEDGFNNLDEDDSTCITETCITFAASTTKAILNQCSVTAGLGYEMWSDGDNDIDPRLSLNVRFTYWVF